MFGNCFSLSGTRMKVSQVNISYKGSVGKSYEYCISKLAFIYDKFLICWEPDTWSIGRTEGSVKRSFVEMYKEKMSEDTFSSLPRASCRCLYLLWGCLWRPNERVSRWLVIISFHVTSIHGLWVSTMELDCRIRELTVWFIKRRTKRRHRFMIPHGQY